jgi:hypothetical protein
LQKSLASQRGDARSLPALVASFTTSRDGVLLAVLIAFGALLRVRDYLVNRSLWLDEAWLALNVLGRSTADLILRRLDFNQAAPPGFLLLVKLGVLAWGGSEYVLRLVPLLFSLASLPLFAWVARRTLAPAGALMAVALAVMSPELIRYAAEFKQYGLDVAVGIGVIATALPFFNGSRRTLHAVALCLTGAVAVWFSHPAPFFLAAVGVAVLIQWRLKGQPAIGTLIAIGTVWVASFAVMYTVSLRDLAANQGLREAWAGAFAPSVFSFSLVGWLGRQVKDLFAYTFAGELEGVSIFAVLAGSASLVAARPVRAVLLVAPMGFALLAALLGRYPFQNRLVLFTLPLLALLAGEGVDYVRANVRGARVVTALFVAMVLFGPAYASFSHLIRPFRLEEVRPVIAYVQHQSLPDDVIYLAPSAAPAFRYHAPRMGFRPKHVIVGEYVREEWPGIAANLAQLRGDGRVWVLLSHFRPEEEQFVRYYLDAMGPRRDSFTAPGATALLYDLR